MMTSKIMTKCVALFSPFLLIALVSCGTGQVAEQSPKQQTFQSAEDAVVAMVDALKAHDTDKLVAIFGPEAREAMNSGDEVADQRGRDLFIAAYTDRCVARRQRCAPTSPPLRALRSPRKPHARDPS